MAITTVGVVSLFAVLFLIAIRVPIGIVMLVVSFCGIWAGTAFPVAWGMARAIPFDVIANWSFSAIPMFLLMGYMASHGGLTSGLFTALRIVTRNVPGGLAVSGVGACALFSAASGSSVATSAAMAKISVPEMLKAGYDKALATGTIAAGGTLGSLIPPSILMIIYGIFAQVSIGDLFMAGVIPGILSAVMYAIMIMIRAKLNPKIAPKIQYDPSRAEKIAAFKEVWPLPALIMGVLGAIFAGIATPTEAGALGAFIAVVLCYFRGTLKWKTLSSAIRDAAFGTSTIFIIVVGATMFTSFIGMTGVPAKLSSLMLSIADDQLTMILMIAVIYLILGMFIEGAGIMLLTLPIIYPLLQATNTDMIWFGIIVIKLLEIGMVTPPVGLNCYVMSSALKGQVPLSTVFRGALWFVATDIVTLGLLIGFPIISLWLPSLN